MAPIETQLAAIEARAEATRDYMRHWNQVQAVLNDEAALVKALRRAIRGLRILDGNGTLHDIAAILAQK